jgi:hypothetical protein
MFGVPATGETCYGGMGLEERGTAVSNYAWGGFRILQGVSQSVALPYDVKGFVANSAALSFDVNGPVANSVELSFKADGVLFSGIATSFHILKQKQNLTRIYYKIDGILKKEVAIPFHVFNAVHNDLEMPFHVLQQVSSDITLENRVYAYSFVVNQNRTFVLGKNKQIAMR